MGVTGERQTAKVAAGLLVEPLAGPMRMCVGCRAKCAQSQLLRFGLQREAGHAVAQVAPAIGARPPLGGRSAYLCPRRTCLDRAIKRRVFTRALCPGPRSGSRASRGRGRSRSDSPDLPGSSGSSDLPDLPFQSIGSFGADTLWTATADLLRREIDLLDRCTENTHAHLRRRGLERLLFELSSQPAPSDRRSRSNGQGGTPTHG